MAMNKPMKVSRRKKSNLIPVLIMLVFALLLSLLISGVWLISAGAQGENASSDASRQRLRSSSSEPEEKEESSDDEPEPASAPKPEPEPEIPVFEGAVPASDWVSSDYFNDAVFVGDSISTGIELYGVMDGTTVLAGTGANLSSIYTEPYVKQEDGSRIAIMDGLKQAQFRKVYILLGGNEVRDVEKSRFIERYSSFLDDVRELQPDALIYVQSILPVTRNNNYNMDNNRIDEFNQALLTLCGEKQVYYLNVAECMKDENGMLPDAASPADGMHFGPEYYNKWFDYLKQHTVSVPGGPAAASTTNVSASEPENSGVESQN